MEKTDFLKQMQRYVANIAISGSTLRNQGAKGVAEAARNFLFELDLSMMKKIKPSTYSHLLDEWTSGLKEKLPKGARNWGTARKAINVFMVQAFLNKSLATEYELGKFADVLETPLDSQATKEMRKLAGRRRLPRWTSIKSLTPESSGRYQEFASELAKEKNLSRAYLDMILWRAGQ